MKPHRIRMTHNLLLNYGLYKKMAIYVRTPAFSWCFRARARALFFFLSPPSVLTDPWRGWGAAPAQGVV
jgi:hypothetical protein